PQLPAIVKHFGTPFHIYDETGIRETCERALRTIESFPGFREYIVTRWDSITTDGCVRKNSCCIGMDPTRRSPQTI
ncbi:MAG: hypothetical protein JNM70_23245, partial [Anaerolineae bacterium]|nr:hypothetical protein [Anaerolineae bacterium]